MVDRRKIFDAIIAGAGPAGCVLASRLSEDSNKQVLLIEAGPDVVSPGAEHPDLLDPFALRASRNSAFHWPSLVAETGADPGDGSTRTTSAYVQGYGVGGASNINGMGVDRGQPGDYDEWCDLGADGWAWKDVLPYFTKLEHDLDFPASPMHGDTGPMPVRRLPRARWAPFAAAIGDALERRGFDFIDDYTADFREGFSAAPTNCLVDRRVSAPMAYLTEAVRRRPNLQILANTRVERVSLEGRRASGVFVYSDGAAQSVCGREVIVTCGAIQSPALLMRSGIGPRGQLAKHGIDIVQHLPGVGDNLQNHPSIALTAYLPRTAAQGQDNPWFLQHWARYSSQHPGCARNDMHLMAFNKGDWHDLGSRVGAVVVTVLKAYSTGSVELSGSAAAATPKVRFNLMADTRDLERLVGGLRLMLELLTDNRVRQMRHQLFHPNARLIASLNQRTLWNRLKARALVALLDRSLLRRLLLANACIDPGKLAEDRMALRRFVRERVQLQFHVCGTCRMGRPDDAHAVVDAAGRVHGIEALRVADASIFPTIPRGYPHFIVLMAAEKIAEAIKTEWRSVLAA